MISLVTQGRVTALELENQHVAVQQGDASQRLQEMMVRIEVSWDWAASVGTKEDEGHSFLQLRVKDLPWKSSVPLQPINPSANPYHSLSPVIS